MNRFCVFLSRCRRSLCLVALAVPALHPAAADPARPPADGGLWHTVSDHRLDAMRGGFDVGGGLLVNFGISRAVYVNGALVTETTLNLGDLSRVNADQAARLQSQLGGLTLVQNGPGNSVAADIARLANGVIVQNTLNNQQISAQTVINASSNGLSMVRDMNTRAAIDEAIHRAVGPR